MMASFRYTNDSSQFVVLKLSNCDWERTVLPGQTLAFKADPQDYLEVYSATSPTCLLDARLACHHLESVAPATLTRPTHSVPVLSAA